MAIKEDVLRRIIALRKRVAVLKHDVADEERKLEAAESGVIQLLWAGERVTGRYQAQLETVAGKCSPPWKDVYLQHMEMVHDVAASEAEQVVRENTPTSQAKQRLVVSGPSKRAAA